MSLRSFILSALRLAKWPAGVLLTLNLEKCAEKVGADGVLRDRLPMLDSAIDMLQSGWVQVPALVVAGGALALWASGRFDRPAVTAAAAPAPIMTMDEIDGHIKQQLEDRRAQEAYDQLIRFVIDYLFPATEAQHNFQRAIVQCSGASKDLRYFVAAGADSNYEIAAFAEGESGLATIGASPSEVPPFDDLMRYVAMIEQGYAAYCRQAVRLASALGVSMDDPAIQAAEAEWLAAHQSLVAAYEDIKKDNRYPLLFRPLRRSRWNDN